MSIVPQKGHIATQAHDIARLRLMGQPVVSQCCDCLVMLTGPRAGQYLSYHSTSGQRVNVRLVAGRFSGGICESCKRKKMAALRGLR